MPNTLKRKASPSPESEAESFKRRFAETTQQAADVADPGANAIPEEDIEEEEGEEEKEPEEQKQQQSPENPQQDRLARFAALRARNNDSRKSNLKATSVEAQRLSTDPALLSSLNRKRDTAQEKLLKADTEEAGQDYERKRAWDWTIDESERWDRKVQKRASNKQNNAFHDFSQEALKVYERQLREMKPDTEAYDREKVALIDRAAATGGLEVVETQDGELIAVDRDGSFYSTAESTEFVQNKPSKEAIDKLVGQMRKAEEVRLKQRKDRKGAEDDGDVTYINDKNKQFNQKLARFYNKYTSEIRENFERGTAL